MILCVPELSSPRIQRTLETRTYRVIPYLTSSFLHFTTIVSRLISLHLSSSDQRRITLIATMAKKGGKKNKKGSKPVAAAVVDNVKDVM